MVSLYVPVWLLGKPFVDVDVGIKNDADWTNPLGEPRMCYQLNIALLQEERGLSQNWNTNIYVLDQLSYESYARWRTPTYWYPPRVWQGKLSSYKPLVGNISSSTNTHWSTWTLSSLILRSSAGSSENRPKPLPPQLPPRPKSLKRSVRSAS